MSSHRIPGSLRSAMATLLGAASIAASFPILSGCGTPGAPQPPSLKLPETVSDLTAVRAGSSVTLHWTMPKKTVDHLLLKAPVPVTICWREKSEPCHSAGSASVSPGIEYDFQTSMPDSLAHGDLRPVSWFVELKNSKGRSAGRSNPAVLLAGQAPGLITGLSAETRPNGAALHWTQSQSATAPRNASTLVRLHRKLLTPPAPKKSPGKDSATLRPSSDPILTDLLVTPQPDSPAGALDKTARFGETYEYTAQRLILLPIDGKAMELAGEISAPVQLRMIDTFPPTIPHGLVAVYVPEEKTIDLSWEPDADPGIDQDLAGYIVYRAETAPSQPDQAHWIRVSPAQPLSSTAYRDASIVAGHNYRYTVTAIDQTGHESNRSGEATESVPNP